MLPNRIYIVETRIVTDNWRVYEPLVGKRAVKVRRDPLQRVREESVPMGGRAG